jgi:DNA-binding transcriptional LysR family regulator
MDRMLDWDDLRFFLAVARGGSVSAAARALHVHHATVSRRLHAFEQRVGARLFDRLPGGWAVTTAGEEMRSAALRVEEEVQALDRRVLAQDADLSGKLRVALADSAAYALLPELHAFSLAYPKIELELTAANHLTNLTRREADVAIRVTRSPADHLVGRKVGTVAFALYGSTDYLDASGDLVPLDQHPWLGWDESLAELGAARWMRENVPNAHLVARFDSVLIAYHATREGFGVCFLPCALADRDATLRRVDQELLVPCGTMWLLTHPDLRRTARVRRFIQFMSEAMARMRDAREGRLPLGRVAPARGVQRAPRGALGTA